MWLIHNMSEQLEGFDFNKMWAPELYNWLIDFCNSENNKLFCWVTDVGEENSAINFSSAAPPRFYGKYYNILKFKFLNLKSRWRLARRKGKNYHHILE